MATLNETNDEEDNMEDIPLEPPKLIRTTEEHYSHPFILQPLLPITFIKKELRQHKYILARSFLKDFILEKQINGGFQVLSLNDSKIIIESHNDLPIIYV